MPNLGQIVKRRVKVFEVGHQKADFPSEEDPQSTMKYECIPILLIGGVIVISDDVFQFQPAQALMLVQRFIQKVERLKRSGDTLVWRLGTRPGLLKYLLELSSLYSEDADAGEPEHKW
jgi:chromo domain-containing protein 1